MTAAVQQLYSFACNWAFDRVFGVPASAVNDAKAPEQAAHAEQAGQAVRT